MCVGSPSRIDGTLGYWPHLQMKRIERKLPTSLSTFNFKVMSFGLCHAPATSERMMDSLLCGFQ